MSCLGLVPDSYLFRLWSASYIPCSLGHALFKLRKEYSPGLWNQLVGASSLRLKGHGFDSQSGHIPGLQVDPWTCTYEKATNVSLSHQCFSLSLSPSPPAPFFKSNEKISLDEKKEKDYKGKPNCLSTFKIPAFVISAIFFYQIKSYGQIQYQ